MTTTNHQFGWKRDLPDKRDLLFTIPEGTKAIIPLYIDLRAWCPDVYDQGNLGSCTANAVGALYQYNQIHDRKQNFMPSRLFIYYNTRILEKTVSYDSGATLRNSIKSINKYGLCPEKIWSYNIKKYTNKPHSACYISGIHHKATQYARVSQKIKDIKSCLAAGDPIVFGFTVYESFENIGSNGIMPMPTLGESLLGGHAVMVVGYNDETQLFTIRNSWGKKWGDNGYFYMPYNFLLDPDYCFDLWKVTVIRDTRFEKKR